RDLAPAGGRLRQGGHRRPRRHHRALRLRRPELHRGGQQDRRRGAWPPDPARRRQLRALLAAGRRGVLQELPQHGRQGGLPPDLLIPTEKLDFPAGTSRIAVLAGGPMSQVAPEAAPHEGVFKASVDSHARAVAKGVTWRIIGTLDTFLWSWLI